MSALWFLIVGASAAAVHMLVVWLLVEQQGWHPLLSNTLGFLVAFCVSFAGHHGLTFAKQGVRAVQSLPRFALVALLGFVSNELMFAALLKLGMDYRLALFLVLMVVAAMTWILSKYWAFAARRKPNSA